MKFETAIAAERAFYLAFEAADIQMMMDIWSNENILCIHPMGDRLTTHTSVIGSYKDIFSAGPKMRFDISDRIITSGDDIACHTLIENVSINGKDKAPTQIYATNLYRLTKEGWKMTMHQACLAPTQASVAEESQDPVLH